MGLDASTSVIGVSMVDETQQVLLVTHIDLTKCKTLWEKCDLAEKRIAELFNEHRPDVVMIEEALKRFQPGMSSANVISLLLRWNGIVSFFVYRLLGIPPLYISANEARKLAGVKCTTKAKSGGLSQKEQVVKHMLAHDLAHITFDITKTGKYQGYVGDQVDAYVLAKAASLNTVLGS